MSRVLIKEMKFKCSGIDHLVFYQKTGNEHTIIAVATNDMAVTSKRAVNTNNFKNKVKKHWEITDHGPIQWFLGFQIK